MKTNEEKGNVEVGKPLLQTIFEATMGITIAVALTLGLIIGIFMSNDLSLILACSIGIIFIIAMTLFHSSVVLFLGVCFHESFRQIFCMSLESGKKETVRKAFTVFMLTLSLAMSLCISIFLTFSLPERGQYFEYIMSASVLNIIVGIISNIYMYLLVFKYSHLKEKVHNCGIMDPVSLLIVIKFIGIILDVFVFSYMFYWMVAAVLFDLFAFVALLTLHKKNYLDLCSDVEMSRLPELNQVLQESGLQRSYTKDLLPSLERLDAFIKLQKIRNRYHLDFKTGQRRWIWLCAGLMLWYVGNFGFYFYQTITWRQSGFYSSTNVMSWNDIRSNGVQDYYGDHFAPGNKRVVLIVLDGLNLDATWKNEKFNQFLTSSRVWDNSLNFTSTASLPTFSVPNWVTLITGMQPEFSQVLGDLELPEIQYDSIFRSCKSLESLGQQSCLRGLTGSVWWGSIAGSTLPWLQGDGVVDIAFTDSTNPLYNAELYPHPLLTSDPADWARQTVLTKAVMQKPDCANTTCQGERYRFFLAHFSDIDVQGHSFGVDRNPYGSYYAAVTNKTVILESLIDTLEADNDGENTILIITSDHGQLHTAGGHGGTDPDLFPIPMIIYQKNSNLRTSFYKGEGFAARSSWESIDVAPTISAILGIPIPRQAQGVFINPLIGLLKDSSPECQADINCPAVKLRFYDLYRQKLLLLQNYVSALNVYKWTFLPLKNVDKTLFVEIPQNETIDVYIKQIEAIMSEFNLIRNNAFFYEVFNNICVTMTIVLTIGVYFVYDLNRFTFCDLTGLFMKKVDDVEWLNLVDSPLIKAEFLWARSMELKALKWAIAAVTGYFTVVIILYNVIFNLVGYSIWDTTQLHAPAVIPRYLAISTIPAFICEWALVRFYHIPWIQFEPFHSFTEKLYMYFFNCVGPFQLNYFNNKLAHMQQKNRHWFLPEIGGIGFIYLCKNYILLMTVISMLSLMCFQSFYGFIVPGMFDIHYLNATTWNLRYRVLTIQYMCLPLLIGNTIVNFMWPSSNDACTTFDRIYILKAIKDLRHRSFDKIIFPNEEDLKKDTLERLKTIVLLACGNRLDFKSTFVHTNILDTFYAGAAPDALTTDLYSNSSLTRSLSFHSVNDKWGMMDYLVRGAKDKEVTQHVHKLEREMSAKFQMHAPGSSMDFKSKTSYQSVFDAPDVTAVRRNSRLSVGGGDSDEEVGPFGFGVGRRKSSLNPAFEIYEEEDETQYVKPVYRKPSNNIVYRNEKDSNSNTDDKVTAFSKPTSPKRNPLSPHREEVKSNKTSIIVPSPGKEKEPVFENILKSKPELGIEISDSSALLLSDTNSKTPKSARRRILKSPKSPSAIL